MGRRALEAAWHHRGVPELPGDAIAGKPNLQKNAPSIKVPVGGAGPSDSAARHQACLLQGQPGSGFSRGGKVLFGLGHLGPIALKKSLG